MRESVQLECTKCKRRNYVTLFDTRGGKRLERNKFCRWCRVHTLHRMRKK